jgi:pimeloyl-ACP methyl ester carboxylesterase
MSRSESVTFRAGEVELAGTLLLPDAPPPAANRRYPNALLLASWLPRNRDGAFDRVRHASWFGHGPTGEDEGRLLARLAEALAERGVATLRYDKRGCGASGGSWEGSDLFTLIDDARDALAWIRSRRDLDLRRSALVGHGEGASLAVSVAIADPAVSALTLIGAAARSGRSRLRRAAAERERTWLERDHPFVAALDRYSEELIERADRGEAQLHLPLPDGERVTLALAGWEQSFRTPPQALVTMLHRSVTLLHGGRDCFADPGEAELLVTALRSGGNEPQLRLEPELDHHLSGADDELIRWIADDLVARMEPRALPPLLQVLEEM